MARKAQNDIKDLFRSQKNDTSVTSAENIDIDAPKSQAPTRSKTPSIIDNLPDIPQFKENVEVGTPIKENEVDFSNLYTVSPEEIVTAYISDLSKFLIGEKNQRIIDNVNDITDWVYDSINRYGIDATATMIQDAISAGIIPKYDILYDYAKSFKYISDMERYLPNAPKSDETMDGEWVQDASIEWEDL